MHTTLRPSVILLHSSGSSAKQWQALSEALTPQYCVHAVDFHDHGNQREWSSDATLTLADEAALVTPLLPPEGAHVIGHSYGGAVALKVAAMHPQQV
ncbi:MAG: alpha/beta fold hydrolase, partial [Burkholderiaceae bacterium]